MFNLDAVADEEARNPWEFTLGGRVWRVPHVADLTLEQQIHVDSGRVDLALEGWGSTRVKVGDEWVPTYTEGEGDDEVTLHADAELARAIRRLGGKRRGILQVAWLAHAGVEPGESGASSRS